MKTRVKLAFSFVIVFLLIRLIFVIATSETGWSNTVDGWSSSSRGAIGLADIRYFLASPPSQATTLLRKTNDATDFSPSELIGGALVLDSPCQDHATRHTNSANVNSSDLIASPNSKTLSSLDLDFEELCSQRCLEFAKLATEKEPSNRSFWQLRALLLWQYSIYAGTDRIRSDDWSEVLQECIDNDPGNPLYSYLAAYFYWKLGSRIEFKNEIDETEYLETTSARLFNQGSVNFERASHLGTFELPIEGCRFAESFLAKTEFSKLDTSRIVYSRMVNLKSSLLLRRLWYRQNLIADGTSDIKAKIENHRKNLRLIDQFRSANLVSKYDDVALRSRVATLETIADLVEENVDVLGSALSEKAKRDLASATRVLELVELAEQQWRLDQKSLVEHNSITFEALSYASRSAMFTTLILALIGYFLSDNSGNLDSRWQPLSFLIVAAFISFAISGFVASSSRDVQKWVLTIVILASLFASLGVTARKLVNPKLKFRLLHLFAILSLTSFSFALVASIGFSKFQSIPFNLYFPNVDFQLLAIQGIQTSTSVFSSWFYTFLNWVHYNGLLWCFVFYCLLDLAYRMYSSKQNFLSAYKGTFGALTRLCILVFVFSAIVYLTLEPSVLSQKECKFLVDMKSSRAPLEYWQFVDNFVTRQQ